MKRDPSQKPQRMTQDIFTDREKYIEVFDRYLNAAGSETLKVLVFYGVGGIGKTKLQIKLMELLQNSKTPIPHAKFNLENAGDKVNAYRKVFLSMRCDLEREFKISFRTFDLCWAVIAAHEGGEPEPLLHANPFLANALKLAVSLGGAPAGEISSLIDRGIRKSPALEKQIRSVFNTDDVLELRSIARRDDKLLVSELIRRFVNDLNEGLTGRENKACKGVLFLDTYESLWAGQEGGRSAQARMLDEWVRERWQAGASALAFCL